MKRFLFLLSALVVCISLDAEVPWRAKWITKSQNTACTNSWTAYRKDFNIDGVPSSMKARIATDTKYWMWINDSLVVFEGGLKRGPSPADTY